MKTVFKSNEIAHIWANKGAPSGRSPGNLSFEGNAILSFATVIARRIEYKGKEAYIFDRYSFSSHTGKSQSKISQAIRGQDKVFHVSTGVRGQSLNWDPSDLFKHYMDKAVSVGTALPSRYAFKRAEQYNSVTSYLKQALEVCTYFDLPCAILKRQIAKRQAGEATASDTLKAYRQKRIDTEKASKIKEAKAKTARNIENAKAYIAKGEHLPLTFIDLERQKASLDTLPADLRAQAVALVEKNNARFTAHKLAEEAQKVADWRAGQEVSLPSDTPTMLRIEGNEMVTSRGARVPLTHARRTYAFITAKRAQGWHSNGETHQIGAYHLESVNESGVIVGCHRVTWEEIERFASSQGWSKKS